MAEVYRQQLEEMTTLHEVAKTIEQNVQLHTTIIIFKLELQLEALFHSPYSLGISSTDHRFFQNSQQPLNRKIIQMSTWYRNFPRPY